MALHRTANTADQLRSTQCFEAFASSGMLRICTHIIFLFREQPFPYHAICGHQTMCTPDVCTTLLAHRSIRERCQGLREMLDLLPADD